MLAKEGGVNEREAEVNVSRVKREKREIKYLRRLSVKCREVEFGGIGGITGGF